MLFIVMFIHINTLSMQRGIFEHSTWWCIE